MTAWSSPGKVHPYCFKWKPIALVVRQEMFKIKKELAKYSQQELDAAKHEQILSKMLGECTCEENRQYPLEQAYHIGSTAERYAVEKKDEFEDKAKNL